MNYLDPNGRPMSEADFRAAFGVGVRVERVPGAVWTVEALQDSGDNAPPVIELLVLADPAGVNGRLTWPGGSATSPEWKDEPMFLPHPFSPLVATVKYFPDRPDEPGPYTADLVAGETGVSEKVHGLGLAAGTNHRHVRVWYRKGSPPPEPINVKSRLNALAAEARMHAQALTNIASEIEELAGKLP
jgi:hypothetical protein